MAVVLFVVTSLAFVAPALFEGPTFGATDIVTSFAPYDERSPTPVPADNPLQGDQAIQLPLPAEFWSAARSGELQLWEPDIAGGTPLFPAVYNRLLSPLNWPFAVLPAAWAPTAGVFLGMLLAQLGVYGLARRFGVGIGGAMFAGVAYAFSGPMTAFALRFHEFFLLPAWLFALHGTVTDDDRRWGFAALAGAVAACLWFGGFPAAAVMSTYTAGAFTAWLMVSRARPLSGGDRIRFLLRRGLLVGTAVGAGLAVAAVQLLPTLEFLGETLARERIYGHHHLPVEALAMTLSGRFFGTPQHGDWWWPDLVNIIESGSGMGILTVVAVGCLVVGIRGRPSGDADRAMTWFVAPAAVLLLQADYVGRPVLALLQQLPLLDETLFTRSRAIAMLMVALLAGHALDRVLGRAGSRSEPLSPAPWPLRVLAAYVPAMVALGAARAAARAIEAEHVRAVARHLVVPGTAAMIGIALVALAVVMRRHVAVAATGVTLLLAVELQFGALGLTPASPTFYPDDPALDVLEAETGPGAPYRYFDRPNLAFYGHAGAYRDLSDALAHWPAYGPYQQVLELSDPGVAAASEGKAVFEPAFTEELDLASPALDAISAGVFLVDLASPPEQVGPARPVAHSLSGGNSRVTDEMPIARTVILEGVTRPAGCADGWIELTVGSSTHRRLVRELPETGAWTFPVPDVSLDVGMPITVSATDCSLDVDGATVLGQPAASGDLQLVSVDGWQAYRRPTARPRLELARATQVITDPNDRLDAIATRRDDTIIRSDGSAAMYRGGTVRFVSDDPDRVEISVDSDGPGLVVLRDVAAPGWHVSVDGEAADMVEIDHAFRGVEVPDGSSTVEFTYAPNSLRRGALVALAGLLVLAVLVTMHARRDRRPRGEPESSR